MTEVPLIYRSRNRRPLKVDGSVAVVGSSDLLAGNHFGAAIDAHDVVFRFNLAPVGGEFLAHTGSQADYYLMSQHITTHKFPHAKAEQQRFIRICRKCEVICYPGHEKNILPYNKRPFHLGITPDTVNQIMTPLVNDTAYRFSVHHHPRNGIKLLACLLAVGIRPALFGFDVVARGENRHYFDDEVQIEGEKTGHKPSIEYGLLLALSDRGLIEIY
ncbi:MAG: glycosyltransferase family 29 protein [Pseudomonadota bacterium]